jgi:hypothetical protein
MQDVCAENERRSEEEQKLQRNEKGKKDAT